MFSRPDQLFSTVHMTISCQFSPAATSIVISSLFSEIIFLPCRLILTIVPGKSLVNRTLAPVPRNMKFLVKSSCLMSSKVLISTSSSADAGTRRVFRLVISTMVKIPQF